MYIDNNILSQIKVEGVSDPLDVYRSIFSSIFNKNSFKKIKEISLLHNISVPIVNKIYEVNKELSSTEEKIIKDTFSFLSDIDLKSLSSIDLHRFLKLYENEISLILGKDIKNMNNKDVKISLLYEISSVSLFGPDKIESALSSHNDSSVTIDTPSLPL